MPKRILDAGTGKEGTRQVRETFPEDEIVTLGRPGSGCDIEIDMESPRFQALETGLFDVIVMSHSLEHLSLRSIQPVLTKMRDLLYVADEKHEGVLHIMVPGLEWAAARIRKGLPDLITLMHVYGNQMDGGQYHKSGFTLPTLREHVVAAGFAIRQAGRAPYGISVTDPDGHEQVIQAEELYVVGMKTGA